MDTRTTLTVTAKGQVTLKKNLLDHLGVKPGDRIIVDLCMPDGAVIRAASRTDIDAFFGCLPNKGLSVSIDDMNKAIADGWAKESQ
jgi:antitoxin PrlF